MHTSLKTKEALTTKRDYQENPKQMSEISIQPLPTDLEELSNMLLSNAGALSRYRESYIYTEQQLARKIRDEYKRLESKNTNEECGLESDIQDIIIECAITELSELAHLSALQQIIFGLYVKGLSCSDISILLRKKRKTTWENIQAARYRIKKILREGKYAGWYEVYLSEVNRNSRAKVSKNT